MHGPGFKCSIIKATTWQRLGSRYTYLIIVEIGHIGLRHLGAAGISAWEAVLDWVHSLFSAAFTVSPCFVSTSSQPYEAALLTDRCTLAERAGVASPSVTPLCAAEPALLVLWTSVPLLGLLAFSPELSLLLLLLVMVVVVAESTWQVSRCQ